MTDRPRIDAATPRDRRIMGAGHVRCGGQGAGRAVAAGLSALMLAAAALPATALDAACRFTVECFEDEPCGAADFVLRLRPGDAPMSVRLGGPVDDINGELGVAESGATLVLARGPSSLQILTIGPDDSARYTLHLTDGPAMVSYIGTCEDE